MHILLLTDSVPLEDIILIFFPAFISMKILQLYYLNCILSIVDHLQIWPEGSDHLQIPQ
jgi:hypothetical protein